MNCKLILRRDSAFFTNALFDKGFRAVGNFQQEIELTYRLKLLLCELINRETLLSDRKITRGKRNNYVIKHTAFRK